MHDFINVTTSIYNNNNDWELLGYMNRINYILLVVIVVISSIVMDKVIIKLLSKYFSNGLFRDNFWVMITLMVAMGFLLTFFLLPRISVYFESLKYLQYLYAVMFGLAIGIPFSLYGSR